MVIAFLVDACNPPSSADAQVDVDELEEVSAAAKVVAMPTIQVYKQGNIVDKTTGARTEALTTMLDAALAPK
eukprot:3708305-Pleurochrysis_carterae.AAC.3